MDGHDVTLLIDFAKQKLLDGTAVLEEKGWLCCLRASPMQNDGVSLV